MTSAEKAPRQSWFDFAQTKLSALCDSLNVPKLQAADAEATLRRMMAPWGNSPRSAAPGWPSDITDDHSPFELSVSVEPSRVDMRILLEAQGPNMEADAGWQHALELNERLEPQEAVSLDRFRTIQHLFEPDSRIKPRFALWHAAVVPSVGPVNYKLYLNPQVLGPTNAPGLVREALEVLRVDNGWEAVQQLMAVDATHNSPLYFALDLKKTDHARVKVYVAHEGVHAGSLNKQLSLFANYQPGHASSLIGQLADHDGPFDQRPVLTCLSFTGAQAEPEVTLHFPVRCYAKNDDEVSKRVERVVGGAEGTALRQAIGAYAKRPLETGSGLVTYVSFRASQRGKGGNRVVAYLSPEAYEVAQPQQSGSEASQEVKLSGIQPTLKRHQNPTLQDLEAHIEFRQNELLQHAYIKRLEAKASTADVAVTARGLAFFVMAFQDVLRVSAERANDPVLAPMIKNHYGEDAGHEQWFLGDLEKLGIDVNVPFLFSPEHTLCREVGFELVGEAMVADDAKRLALVLSLEAIGHVFFERVISCLEAFGEGDNLQYFGRFHQDIENSHALFEGDAQDQLSKFVLERGRFDAARAAVDRTFDLMQGLAADLLTRIHAQDAAKAKVG